MARGSGCGAVDRLPLSTLRITGLSETVRMQEYHRRSLTLLLVALSMGACGDGGPADPVVDALLEPFVGTWDAEVILVTSDADTTQVADLMENGSFAINVQASGNYTATLTFGGIPLTEFGVMSVAGSIITLRTDGGQVSASEYAFESPTYVSVDGPTEFDFNLDGALDPAQIYMEWRKR